MRPAVPSRRVRLVVIGCIAIVVIPGVIVRATGVTQLELDVFTWFNEAPDGLGRPLWLVMQLGSFWGAVAVGVVLMAFLRGRRGALAVTVAAMAAWLLARIAKELVRRGRPAEFLPSVNTRFEAPASGHGYASGHTAVAFALATVIAPSLSNGWRWLPYLLAVVVGVSRMYFGAHLPLDLLGGAAIGVAVGLVTRTVCGIEPQEALE